MGRFTIISSRTQTPIAATGLAVFLVLVLALFFPLEALAETTSRITLIIFTLVNAALVRLKRRDDTAHAKGFHVPIWVPTIGCIFCVLLLVIGFIA